MTIVSFESDNLDFLGRKSMRRRLRKLFAAVAACGTIGLILYLDRWHNGDIATEQVLAADGPFRWYRGNIHTHTLWSDGDDYPEMVALWYKDHGYQFLSFSDHNTLLKNEQWIGAVDNLGGQTALDKLNAQFRQDWVETRTNADGVQEIRLKSFDEIVKKIGVDGKFLLIQGEEISDHFRDIPVHMNATNVQEMIPPMRGDSFFEVMQRNTDALATQRQRTGQPMIIHLNHPNFQFAITAEDLARVRGENLFEVYNGHPLAYNDGDESHASAEHIWDVILTLRIAVFHMPLMFGLATDDGHSYHNIPSRASEPGRGWIEVLSRELTPEAIVKSIERGFFYASTGVKVDRYLVSLQGADVLVHPEEGVDYTIDFIGTRSGYDKQIEPVLDDNDMPVRTTQRYSNDVGRVIKTVTGSHAHYTFDPNDLYIRARITSSKKHSNPSVPGEYQQAWCQPVRGPAGRHHP
jgi:hypothetical protein